MHHTQINKFWGVNKLNPSVSGELSDVLSTQSSCVRRHASTKPLSELPAPRPGPWYSRLADALHNPVGLLSSHPRARCEPSSMLITHSARLSTASRIVSAPA